MARMLLVLEYDILPTADPLVLGRIVEALRERGTHEPLEGARQVLTYAAVGDTADEICGILTVPDAPGQPS